MINLRASDSHENPMVDLDLIYFLVESQYENSALQCIDPFVPDMYPWLYSSVVSLEGDCDKVMYIDIVI